MTLETLTEEVLALAEHVYLAAVARGETRLSDYDGRGGVPACLEREWSAEEEKKWLT